MQFTKLNTNRPSVEPDFNCSNRRRIKRIHKIASYNRLEDSVNYIQKVTVLSFLQNTPATLSVITSILDISRELLLPVFMEFQKEGKIHIAFVSKCALTNRATQYFTAYQGGVTLYYKKDRQWKK